MNTANETYRYLLETILLSKSNVAPRGQGTREYLGFTTKVDMQYPIVTIPSRKLNYRFMAAEAYWILTGQQGLDELTPYCERMKQFSDDGMTLSGAYGPRFLSQVRYISDVLSGGPETRQAVMTLWERNPRPSRDIPCTVSLQWLLRDNKLHCIANMRSSDCWLGWPYDVFSFTMMSAYVLLQMSNTRAHNYELGTLRIFSGSQHLYDRDAGRAIEVSGTPPINDGVISPMTLFSMFIPDDLLSVLGHARDAQNDQVITQLEANLCHSK
jgi:thymidylate synthase